jgi:DNA-binding transcriptional ArsR family regulator
VSGQPSALFEWRRQVLASELGSSARLVALVLSTHMNGDGASCWPGQRRLARETALARSTVRAALDELERAGFIDRDQRPGRTTRYRASGPTIGPPLGRSSAHTGPTIGPEDVQEGVQGPSGGALTRARRGELARAGRRASENGGAQELVAGYVARLLAQGAPAPKRLVGQVAKEVGGLVDDGVPGPTIEAALALMVERRVNPSTLASLVTEAALGPRRTAADARAEQWEEVRRVYDRG